MVLVFIIANLLVTKIITTIYWACVVVGCNILKEKAGMLSRILKPKVSLFKIMVS